MTDIHPDSFLELKRAYQLVFTSPAGIEVFKDLTRFCRAKMTTKGDPMLEGRRQVFLRIQQHLELDPEQLQTMYPTLGDYYG